MPVWDDDILAAATARTEEVVAVTVAKEASSMAWTDDTIAWCEGHEITPATACPDGDDSCRDHCPHYHAAQDAGRDEFLKCRNQIVRFSVEHAADRWIRERYQAERDAFIQAYHEEMRR